MKQTTVVAVILGVLLLVTAVQAVQLNDLKSTISDGQVKVTSGSSKTTNAAASSTGTGTKPALPSNIKDLPQMVGGC